MRKNFGKLMIKTVALTLSLAMLTACSSESKDNTPTPTAQATEGEAQPTNNDVNTDNNEKDKNEQTPVTEAPVDEKDDDPVVTTPADNPENTKTVDETTLKKSDYTKIKVEYKNKDLETAFELADVTKIDFTDSGINVSGKKEVRVTNVNGRQIATITSKGKYLISGTCSNGQIVINAENDKDVRLLFNGINLTCPDSACINERQCDKVVITLLNGTVNTLQGTADFVYEDVEKKNPDACIFAKDDLVINGNGTLNIKTKSAEGIHSTDSVKIISGNINIESGDRAIRGKEFVIVKEADINIKTESDAIRTTIDDDAQLGYVVIEGGNIKIETDSEGIQATGNVQITGGSLDINADGKKANAIKSDRIVFIENATVKVNSNKDIKAVSGVIADEGTIVVRG